MLDITNINNKLAIICGNGDLPKKVISSLINQQIQFVVVGIKGITKKSIVSNYNHIWIKLGEVRDAITQLQHLGVTNLCFVGQITRPSLSAISFDDLGKSILKQYLSKATGDNSLLSIIIKVLEQYNFTIIAAQSIEPNLLSFIGNYNNVEPNKTNWQDIIYGFNIAKQFGKLDIGQSIVVQQNVIIAVEGVEGTANLIKRSKKIIKKQGSKAILIKVKKPNQDNRIDLPTIGEKTVKQAKKSGITGIIIEAGSTIVLNPEKLKKIADKYNIFIVSINEEIIKNKQLELQNDC
ncbi:LpxI family protein [Rickettsiales bacterium LUAb2]